MVQERAKAAAKRKAAQDAAANYTRLRDAKASQQDDDDLNAACQLFFMIAGGLLLALFEALDIDVLIGILLMPVCHAALTATPPCPLIAAS